MDFTIKVELDKKFNEKYEINIYNEDGFVENLEQNLSLEHANTLSVSLRNAFCAGVDAGFGCEVGKGIGINLKTFGGVQQYWRKG